MGTSGAAGAIPGKDKHMNIALIGNWGHHVCVLEETDARPDFRIVGLAPGFEGEDLSSLHDKYGKTATLYRDPCHMLAEARPDVVIISTRLDRIAALAKDAARAGCHCICEKPLALDHRSLLELWQTVEANGTQCIAMLPNRNHPVLAAARRVVEAGDIGEVKLLNARKSYKFNNQRDAWLSRRATYGGTLPWIGIHALDFIHAVADVPFRRVSAMQANVAHPDHPECEDVCIMNLELANGAYATASIDYLRPKAAASHGDDWLRIVGSQGVIEAAMERGQCHVIDRNGHREITSFDQLEPYYIPIIRKCVAAGRAAPNEETSRSFTLTHVALRARDAADTGTIINDLTPPWVIGKKEI